MRKKIAFGIILCCFFILTGLWSIHKIYNNAFIFQTDEAYWVSTARILPILHQRRFRDHFWKEYYGFTNFNGAKYIYGAGLLFMGYTESEIQEAGEAPQTFYKWRHIDNEFPTHYSFYPVLRDARIISALFISCSVCLLMILAFLIFQKVIISIFAGLLFYAHPIIQYLSVHAFSDAFFICFILLALISIVHITKRYLTAKPFHWIYPMLYGLCFGYLITIKINGILFLFALFIVAFGVFLITPYSKRTTMLIQTTFATICWSGIFFFLFQANLFFYPSYTLRQMLEDRVAITQYHIAHYTKTDPTHLILPLPLRIRSFFLYSFPPWLIPPFIAGIVWSISIYRKGKYSLSYALYGAILLTGFVVLNGVLCYVVFDEIRYFLPILPFIILIAVSWMSYIDILLKRHSSFGLY